MESHGARLWLVRHGQTDWNAAGRVQGHTPTDLNAVGRGQAEGLAGFLKGRQFASVWSSDLPRALSTAEILARPLGLRVQVTRELRERSFGKYEGSTAAELDTARAELGLSRTNDLANWTGVPGVETNEALWTRISAILRKISETGPDQDILIATHGGVVARAVYRALQIDDAMPRRFPLSNGIVAIIQWRKDILYLLSLVDWPLIAARQPSEDTASVGTSA